MLKILQKFSTTDGIPLLLFAFCLSSWINYNFPKFFVTIQNLLLFLKIFKNFPNYSEVFPNFLIIYQNIPLFFERIFVSLTISALLIPKYKFTKKQGLIINKGRVSNYSPVSQDFSQHEHTLNVIFHWFYMDSLVIQINLDDMFCTHSTNFPV